MNIYSDFHLGRHFLGLAMNAFVGNLVTLQPNKRQATLSAPNRGYSIWVLKMEI